MLYIGFAFVFGLFIPYMARRFAKFMPATFACALVELCKPEKKVKKFRHTEKYKKFVWHSIMSAFVTLGVVWVALVHFGSFGFGFFMFYLLMLLLLAEIDKRTMLLPDILTIPLLLIGFLAASKGMGLVDITDSVLGAVVGYFLPVLVSLLIVWYRKDAFGGGDIKLLSAIGAWLGVEGLLYVILLSSIIGIIYALLKKRSALAFGPMLAIAGIVVAIAVF